ncbi:hypothetical protein CPJ18_26190 [Agrobacterium rosae]|uniref:Uncharacterized protein n=2 Tax=Agrobacterium rosae TaxID=1972867 RepID=A0AAE5RSQ6_9HYPH|nr:hypothetical protein CPJ18_26190 [Agrobacterium rosae]
MFPTRQLREENSNSHPVEVVLANGSLAFNPPSLDGDSETIITSKKNAISELGDTEAFMVFNFDAISGGIFSIFSIVAEMRALGANTALFSMPGGEPIMRYVRFNNSEIISPFDSFLSLVREGKVKRVHVPEVLLLPLLDLLKTNRIDCSNLSLNILNQNAELMPEKAKFESSMMRFKAVTMTTAHERYSSQEHADRWGLPLKHLSTYVSYDNYKRKEFAQKKNMIVLSPDRMGADDEFLEFFSNSSRGYVIYRVRAVHYEMFKYCLPWAKFCITFGEGLDNYFIETIFTGGIAFAIYNPVFMPLEMKSLPNVFADLQEMEEKIFSVMRDIESDSTYRDRVLEMNYNFLKKIYDASIYRKKLKSFHDGKFDFYPGSDR